MSRFLIEPKCSPGKVLDVDGENTQNGANIHIWEFGQGIHQYFKITDAGDSYVFIESCKCENFVIDVRNSEVRNGTNINIWEKNYTDAQKFKKIDVGDGYYTFKSKLNENYCIDTRESRNENGTNIWLYECNETDAQKFKLIESLDASIKYAIKYSQNNMRSPRYQDYKNNNCANFCSQCLIAGGVKDDDIWKNNSVAFINTIKLKDYFSSKRGVSFKENPNINDINQGDIIYCKNNTGRLGHVMFVIDKNDNLVKFCGNTNDRCGAYININSVTAVLKTSSLLN